MLRALQSNIPIPGNLDYRRLQTSTLWQGDMGDEQRTEKPEICISIDVERDYRVDRRVTVRGIAEGLPVYLDALQSLEIPDDLFVSGGIVRELSCEGFGAA